MQDNTRKIILGVLVGLPTMLAVWIFSLYFFGCGSTNTCTGIPLPELTPIPTLAPASLPAPQVGLAAAAAIPRCHISALNLIGAWVTAGVPEKDAFKFTDEKSTSCTATFKDDVQKLFITPNLWYDGAPACITCHYADVAKATKNMDLSSYAGILAGSNRVNGAPKGNDILGGGVWANALLRQMLYAPGGKTEINRPPMPLGRPPTVPAEGPVISAGFPVAGAAPAGGAAASAAGSATPTSGANATPGSATPATGAGATATSATPGATAQTTAQPTTQGTQAAAASGTPAVARPSNPGDPGDAINLQGDPTSGGQVYNTNCAVCHGEEGHGGVKNPGSDDGTVPALNPIDSTLVDKDYKTYATNLDLFIQHGSTPSGPSPAKSMPAWGDNKALDQQKIADVIAFIVKLNNGPVEATTVDVARPSNPGGAGLAITLTGDAKSGDGLFAQNCAVCHGAKGVGGINNPGSSDGTVPGLNPIDPTIKNASHITFVYNIDLFLEHGSTPGGPNPALTMPAWGDSGKLTPQQIADVIAYLIGLNK